MFPLWGIKKAADLQGLYKWLLVSGGVLYLPHVLSKLMWDRKTLHSWSGTVAQWVYTARSSHYETLGGRSDGAIQWWIAGDAGAGSGLVA